MRPSWIVVLVLLLGFSLEPRADGAVVYDEETMGEISEDNAEPTAVNFAMPGAGEVAINTVRGQTDGPSGVGGAIPDIFTFEIASGFELRQIFLSDYQGEDIRMFVAISPGATFPSSWEDVANISTLPVPGWLGGSTIGLDEFQNGRDVLDILGRNATTAGTGFVPPLGAGQYSFYIQQTGLPNTYALDFHVGGATAVPEPSTTLACCVVSLGALGYRRFKRRKTAKAVDPGAKSGDPGTRL